MSIIKVENLSKKYIIGHDRGAQGAFQYYSLRDSLAHFGRGMYQRLRHPLSPNQEITELEEFWALKDINFEIKQGDRVGIIGRNGAGKSTLLKILSRITEPTSGKITMKGRVASLLEVGTGFHPELTGRENIYLNGAILGMTRVEIKKKFDEIVAFAEVEKFLDTPVKRYSSGMYVRLAFAVAAHLEPEILLVDEVLAVGDAEFQKKCLGKMKDVSKEGRTVLFVSHNMAAISNLCSRGILLDNGLISCFGDIDQIIDTYSKTMGMYNSTLSLSSGDSELSLYIENFRCQKTNVFSIGDNLLFTLVINVKDIIQNVNIGLGILDANGRRVLTFHTDYQVIEKWDIKKKARITINWPECILCSGIYHFEVALFTNSEMLASWTDFGELRILESDYFGTGKLPNSNYQGNIVSKAKWTLSEV